MVVNGRVTRPAGGQMTFEEVANLLVVQKRADGKYHLEDLWTALAINIWSKIKPVRHWSSGPLTAAQRQEANYGFDLSDYGGAASNELATVFSQARAHQGAWEYLRPRGAVGHGTNPGGSDEWYRFLDFEGYNHRAEAPYSSEPPTRLNVHEVKLIDVHENQSAEIKVTDLSVDLFDEYDIDEVYVYLLFREYTNNPATPIQVLVPRGGIMTFAELAGEVGHSAIFETLTNAAQRARNATWEVVGVATAWNPDDHAAEDMEDFNWLYIPGTWQTFTINDQSHILELVYYDSMSESFVAEIDQQTGLLSVDIDLIEETLDTGDTVDDIVMHLEITYRDAQNYRETLYNGTFNGGTVDDHDERRMNISVSGIDVGDVREPAENYIDVRLWYEYVVGTDPYVYKRYFDFDSDSGGSNSYQSLSEIPYVRLSDLI